MPGPLLNRQPQSCTDCGRVVPPYEGRLYAHDGKNPPPKGWKGSRTVSRHPKHKKVATVWLVRCAQPLGPCADIHEAKQVADRVSEQFPDGPHWAA